MENGRLKYYIRPSRFESSLGKNKYEFVDIDFTYQKSNQNYVTDAYVNFTLNSKNILYIKSAEIVSPEGVIVLKNVSTLDRDLRMNYIRVTTTLDKDSVEKVLTNLRDKVATLKVIFEDDSFREYVPTDDFTERVKEAFFK